MPYMEDFDAVQVLSQSIEDPDRRVHETPNTRIVSDGRTHPREAFKEINVIEKSGEEPFRRVRVKVPRPAFNLFKIG
jgi:hypothetical protein